MKKISLWANRNKISARFLVVFIKVILIYLAYYAGNILYKDQLHIPALIIAIAAIVSMCAAVLYPSKNFILLTKHQFYVRQKSCDFILSACTFIIITTFVNNRDTLHTGILSYGFGSSIKKNIPKADEIIASLKYRDKNSLTRVEKRILKKEFFRQLKIYAVAKVNHDKEKADHTLEIILIIILAIGLLALLAALVCTLSCNGSDVAAGIVAVLGITAIVWGSVVLIKSLSRKSKNKIILQPSD